MAWSDRNLQITLHQKGARKEFNVGTKPGNYLGWISKDDIVGYDTGGYTGEWGKEGKMAFLHEKEIVLNKQDTKNILEAVKATRGSSSTFSHIANAILETSNKTLEAIASFVGGSTTFTGATPSNDTIQQVVNIEADFSGVKSANEIEKAFENMANMASQYIHRR